MINIDAFSQFINAENLDLDYDRVVSDMKSVDDVESALEIIFQYHRRMGFPHYRSNLADRIKQLEQLKKFDETNIYKDGKLDQTMHGLGACWHYFPHWVDVSCGNNKMKPIDYWNDDLKLKEIIQKTWKWQENHGNGKFTLNRLRQNFKIYGGNQSVSNFRPSVAKWIYNQYAPNGVIWDMSCGWGGRLFGFLSSNAKKYIGTEPSTKTFDGLLKLKSELNLYNKEIELYKMGSEVFQPEPNTLDLCFTSPPYFDTEKYSDELTQSYIKFPTTESWLTGFLKQTMENCYIGLKPDKYMMINIANTTQYKNIEDETVKMAEEVGFKLEKILYLILSSVAGKGQKLEPIFVFHKC